MNNSKVITTKVDLEGVDAVVAKLRTLGKEGEAAAKKLENSFQRIKVDTGFAAQFARIKTAFTSLQTAGGKVAKSFKDVGTSFDKLGSATGRVRNRVLLFSAALVGVGYGFERLVQGALDSIGELADLSQSLNVSTDDLQGFALAAAQIGVDSGDFTKGIVGINEALDELRKSSVGKVTDGMGKAFSQVVVSGGKVITIHRGIADASKKSEKEQSKLSDKAQALSMIFTKMGFQVKKGTTEMQSIKVVADYFKNVAKDADKLGLAIDLFGPKLGPKMVRYLNLGADGIEQYKQELLDMGALLSSDQIAVGDQAGDKIAALGVVFQAFKNKLAANLAPGIITAVDAVTNTIKDNSVEINRWLKDAGTNFSKFIQDILTLSKGGQKSQLNFPWLADIATGLKDAKAAVENFFYTTLPGAFETVKGYLQPVVDLINSIFGTKLTVTGVLIGAVILQLAGAFGVLFAAIGAGAAIFGALVTAVGAIGVIPALIIAALLRVAYLIYTNWDEITAFTATVWDGIVGIITGAWDLIKQAFSDAGSWISGKMTDLSNGVKFIWEGMTTGIRNLWQSAVDYVISSASSVKDWISGIVASIGNAITRAKELVGLGGSGSNTAQGTGGGRGFAGGGYIRGPGSATSDSIPAWLSNGEFVIRAAAVRKYGTAMLAALNGMRLSPNAVGRFAMGGLVSLPTMPMASLPAAAVGPSSSLTLVLDGQSFGGITASADTILSLERAIKARRVRSTGRPSPYER